MLIFLDIVIGKDDDAYFGRSKKVMFCYQELKWWIEESLFTRSGRSSVPTMAGLLPKTKADELCC